MTDKYFGSHEIRQRDEVVKASTDRNFGLVFAVLFGIVGGLSFYNGSSHWLWWLALAAFIAAVSQARPQLLAPFNRLCADSGGSRPSFRDDAAHRFRDDLAHRSEMMSPTIPG